MRLGLEVKPSIADSIDVTEEVKQTYDALLPDLIRWYQSQPEGMTDEELFFAIDQKFGTRLSDTVCKELNFFDGACVFVAMILVRQYGERKRAILSKLESPLKRLNRWQA